jgi:hypothetical protein
MIAMIANPQSCTPIPHPTTTSLPALILYTAISHSLNHPFPPRSIRQLRARASPSTSPTPHDPPPSIRRRTEAAFRPSVGWTGERMKGGRACISRRIGMLLPETERYCGDRLSMLDSYRRGSKQRSARRHQVSYDYLQASRTRQANIKAVCDPPCSSGGLCIPSNTSAATCQCRPGWAGNQCEQCAPGFFGLSCKRAYLSAGVALCQAWAYS